MLTLVLLRPRDRLACLVFSRNRVGQLPTCTPAEERPITTPVRAWWPTCLTPTSRGSQSCFGLLILSPASRSNTQTRGSDESICDPPRSQRVLPSAPRRCREIMSPESVGIQARMGAALANVVPSLVSSCIRAARVCLTSIDLLD